MTSTYQQQLASLACQARGRAYAPYSKFAVGAALVTTTGEFFLGCNVENASYGLTICAERVALSSSVAAGYRKWAALAVATATAAPPCGACRQVLGEFCDDLEILLVNVTRDNLITSTSLEQLFPQRFHL